MQKKDQEIVVRGQQVEVPTRTLLDAVSDALESVYGLNLANTPAFAEGRNGKALDAAIETIFIPNDTPVQNAKLQLIAPSIHNYDAVIEGRHPGVWSQLVTRDKTINVNVQGPSRTTIGIDTHQSPRAHIKSASQKITDKSTEEPININVNALSSHHTVIADINLFITRGMDTDQNVAYDYISLTNLNALVDQENVHFTGRNQTERRTSQIADTLRRAIHALFRLAPKVE